MLPTITVLTPTFNRATFLRETIESVLDQDYASFDHLVLDDGSTDGTSELLESYARTHPHQFRFVRHENMGQARTLNRGFVLAEGDFICIVNSDDPLLPGALTRLAAELAADPSLVGAYPDFRILDEDGKTEVEMVLPDHSFVDLFRLQMSFGPGVVFSKTMALDIGGWDPRYRIAPDLDFFLRACLYGRFVHVPEVLATWRQHAGTITVIERGGAPSTEERFRILEEFLARPDLPDDIRRHQAEAYRNLHVIVGIELMPEFNRPDDRFIIFDRVGWDISSHTVGVSLEDELIHFKYASSLLQREVERRDSDLEAQRQTIAELQQEIARRDATLDAVRLALSRGATDVAARESYGDEAGD